MGQKTHPVGLRLGIIKGWESNWFGGKTFADKLIEDEKIREYLNARLPKGGISKIVIDRTLKRLIITIHTARPGIVIGKQGQEVERLKQEVKKISNKDVQIYINEVRRQETDAYLVAENIAQQLKARISFRRAMKSAISGAMRMGAEGIKVVCSGRLGGAEMARMEQYKEGRVPLQTLRADIDYCAYTAHTIYGAIGIKVWIFKGEKFGKVELVEDTSAARAARPFQPGGGERPFRDRERGSRGERSFNRGEGAGERAPRGDRPFNRDAKGGGNKKPFFNKGGGGKKR